MTIPAKNLITVSAMLATIMQVLDTTIANVALPHMQGSLSATQDQVTWVLTSYIVASAIMTLPTGWLAGRFGRKNVFAGAIAGFTFASVLCGMAMSIEEMVVFRLLQGVFGAALVPLSQSTLLDINPKEKHASAMALWGVGVMIGPILGPTLGGYLTEYYNWRFVFYINLPIGILSFIGIYTFLPETERHARPFDAIGFLTFSLCIGCFQMILDRGEQADWFNAWEIRCYLGVAVAAVWMFVVHSATTKHPFLSAGLLRDRNLSMGIIFIFFIGIILLATMALLPPYMQHLMGYSAIDVGLLMAPRGIGTMMAMMIVGKISHKLDPRYLIAFGLTVTAFSLFEMTKFTTFVPENLLIRTSIVQGIGLGFIFGPLSTLAFTTLPAHFRTEGAGLFSLMRNMGSSIGVSIVTFLLGQNTQINHAYLAEHITPYEASSSLQALAQATTTSKNALLSMMEGEITRQAATIGYINDFYLMMWIVIATMPLLLLLKPPSRNQAKNAPEMIAE